MDEARKRGLDIDERRLARDLGVPVVPTVARFQEGLPQLLQAISDVASGSTVCSPRRIDDKSSAVSGVVQQLTRQVESVFPDLPNPRWVALRLLDGDTRIAKALETGELGSLS